MGDIFSRFDPKPKRFPRDMLAIIPKDLFRWDIFGGGGRYHQTYTYLTPVFRAPTARRGFGGVSVLYTCLCQRKAKSLGAPPSARVSSWEPPPLVPPFRISGPSPNTDHDGPGGLFPKRCPWMEGRGHEQFLPNWRSALSEPPWLAKERHKVTKKGDCPNNRQTCSLN